jgi:predicted ATPase
MRHLSLDLSSDVTLIVGANGSGKSNIVGAFEFLGRVLDGQLNDFLVRSGGFDRYLHRSGDLSEQTESIDLVAWGDWGSDLSNGYRASIIAAADDRAVVSEWTFFHDRGKYASPHDRYLGTAAESQLKASADQTARDRYVLDVMSGCRVFHFDDTSPDAPPKRRTDIADSLTLQPDARNLAAVLLAMRDESPADYRRVVRTVQTVAPFFEDFELVPRDQSLLFRWKERGIDGVFSADALSDGTLRFICLATLLLQPNPPSTIVLDEPELGLHPFAIHQLAALLRRASDGRRIVAATQSVTLLQQFRVDEVAVVERSSTGTTVSRPDPDVLSGWLDDYSLGELWEKNVLGGRPRAIPQGG